ncbi:tRNA (adenosine(37)-N6)-dimethylallyltransferase MiaA [Fusobacterium hwasookii]|uniref:tRNA dimethylallyltransferase n=1 Tax=Fusobacterium hwasookii ChDC F206 TaxID=1307443 RepID=A0AAC8WJ74_9FUSO|nr:tRNA (adenosine(37)-N6)-dimethylallyltransferase MiaA [Fusobacterium hwasookii]ALQ35079.1 tRNA dimethylallyltransferase [Fusobacterium hwasookii ChDC F206]ALQ38294.1 tRNA dimethylallyltransferase [Fusobacterium hwasookii ChDC F300]QNE68680.1 tRNA (adenosine(37)-N6)-dimethylallyltransferase MiaA [Fusobacterium hwasookii]
MSILNSAIVIAGPTGVGKTKISIDLASELNAEIISSDSAQVYKGLNIGTAKVTEEEMQGIKHHLIDIVEPVSKYSVGNFEKDVNKILNQNPEKNFLLVGGTGLYLNSVTNGLSILPEADKNTREYLTTLDNQSLFELALKYDEEATKEIHPNNRVRLERVVEVFLLTGQKFSELSKKNVKNNNFKFLKIALERDRENLYDRINKRVDIMFTQGLVDEVKNLYKIYGEKLYKLNIIGYNEVIDHINGKISLDEANYRIKLNSRHYAKRQFTWFKADKEYKWFNLDEISEQEIVKSIYTLFNIKA